MPLTRAFSEPRAPLKKSRPTYLSSSTFPEIAYIGMISMNDL